jgi:hypothetical protein
MRRIVTIIATTAVLLGATTAFAVSGTDPRDAKGGLDVRSSSIRTLTLDSRTKRVRIAVATYRAFDLSDGVGSFYWQVDSYGGTAVDYEAYMFGDPKAEPYEPAYCVVQSTNPARVYHAYEKVDTSSDRFVCSVPRHDLKITKSVRWRLAGRFDGIVDRAPDTGWYG